MPRKGNVIKRDVLPDPIYNSKLVTRLINKIILDGKKEQHNKFCMLHSKKLKQKTNRSAIEVFEQALVILCQL